MKPLITLCVVSVLALQTGCSTTSPNTATGAAVGTAIGTGAGLAIGAATGNPKTGAVVGGLLGAGVGASVGADADERDRERAANVQIAKAEAQAAQQQLGMTDIVTMHKNGIDSRVITNQIRSTGSRFQLSASDIQYLHDNGVPSDVVIAMQQSQNAPGNVMVQPRRTVIYERPYYEPVYVCPPPPVYRPAFGVTYIRRW